MQYLYVYCTLTLHHVMECTRNVPNWAWNIERRRMLECCHQDRKEAIICIDKKYGLIKFTKFYQINYNFSYSSTKTSFVTGSILNWGVVRLSILHTDARCSIIILSKNLKYSCKLTEQCFSYIIKELLNWYWWNLARVGCKNARACECILKPTSANITL